MADSEARRALLGALEAFLEASTLHLDREAAIRAGGL
jgi:hypothetical protein